MAIIHTHEEHFTSALAGPSRPARYEISGQNEWRTTVSVPAGETVGVAVNLDVSKIQSFYAQSDGDVTIDQNGTAGNEIQEITADPSLDDPMYDGNGIGISYNGDYAEPTWPPSAADIQAALETMPSIGAGQVSCTGGPLDGTPVQVEFTGTLASTDAFLLTFETTPLIGFPSVLVTAAVIQEAGSGGVLTKSLAADVPYRWNIQCAEPLMFVDDITSLHFTNDGDLDITIVLRVLYNN